MTEVSQELVLELTHRYAAPRTEVFDAWIDPNVLRRWWAAAPSWDTPLAEVDAREGGSYRLSMRTDTGEVHTVGGEFTEVRPPERLAYTWSWEEGPDAAMAGSEKTLVVVDFLEDGAGTLVKLTHSGFANEEIRGMHSHGWEAVLANLERTVFSS
ncbi:MAG TPA: SRPBCC domain-containing protein [Gaiellaceae bacterium]|nr:SRPBCC domain-containing protein [Gaiellaceae bacterium]